MTHNKQFKLEVRRYAEKHGLAYADARRHLNDLKAEQRCPGREGRGPRCHICLEDWRTQ